MLLWAAERRRMVIARNTRSHSGALAAGFSLTALALGMTATAAAEGRYAAYVMDAQTNEVLHADHADSVRFPASLTKVMTLYLLFDAIDAGEITLDTQMPVSKAAALQPRMKLGVRRTDVLRVEDAIRALVTRSANDAAVVVAERLAGSEAAFAQRMTAKARELGMRNTRFMNASGLPNAAQRTTAHDMAILGKALIENHPQYYDFFRIEGMDWRARWIRNHNNLLGRVTGVDGIKTGYVNASGFNLLSSVDRDGKRLIAVVMGGETAAARDAQMAHIIEGAYEELNRRLGPAQAMYVSLPVTRITVAIDPEAEGAGVTAQTAPADRPSYTVPAPTNAFAPAPAVGAPPPVGPSGATQQGAGAP
jgi:D-alanyl-D-alanine carboxypeptidase